MPLPVPVPVPVPASRPRTLIVKAIKPITIQHRTLWHWHSRQPRQPHISWIRIDRKNRPFPSPSQWQPQNKIKNKNKTTDPDDAWTWGTGLKPGFGSVFGSMEWFEKEHQRAQRRMEAIKREIENDPYGVLFGRPGPGSGRVGQSGMGMGQLWKDLFGDSHGHDHSDSHSASTSTGTGADGKSSMPENRPSQAKPRQPTTTTTSDQIVGEKLDRADLEFDPVAGRMVQKIQAKDRGDFDPVTGRMTPKGYLSPIERGSSPEASVQEPEPPQMKAKIFEQETAPEQETKIVQEETKVPEQKQEIKIFGQEQEQEGKLKIQDSTQQAEPILLPEDQELDLLRASDIRASYQTATTPTQIQRSLSSIEERVAGLAEDTALLEAQVEDAQKAARLDTKPIEAEVQGAKDIKQGTGHTYCVLAYDPSTQQVTRANTVSSLTSTSTSTPEYEYETCHPKDILPRLNHPAKFVGYFEQMHKDGYEIVSGGGDILVFRSPSPSSQSKARELPKQDANTKTGAGPGALRRMAFAGTATAATCYAIGVVAEYFRTGGTDGRGMDGFTAFESERKAIAYGA